MKIKHAIDIKSSPEKVWYWLGNPERAKVWQTNVSKTEIIKQTPDMIGTTFRETIEEKGSGTEREGIVIDYRENQALAMHLSGKYNVVDVKWLIEEMGEHTRLTVDSDIRFKSFIKVLSVLIGPVFKKNAIKQLHLELVKLKELCESDNRTTLVN